MASVVLGPFFDKPLHRGNWSRPTRPLPGYDHYRVTNPFTGPDLINGGIHGAVDVGDGQGRGAPICAPVDCRARGLSHWDGALGVELVLSPRVRIVAWHLSATLERGTWTSIRQGQRIGTTGNTGKQPMPFHTHLELWLDEERIDLEPHLFGEPLDLDPRPDLVTIPAGAQALTYAILGAGNRLRVDPTTTVSSRVTEADTVVQLLWRTDRPDAPWEIGSTKGTAWWVVGFEGRIWYTAEALIRAGYLTKPIGESIVVVPTADCSAQENRIAAARTAVAGLQQAHIAEGSALTAAREALG